jgi:hypothetical protein
VPAALIEFLAF